MTLRIPNALVIVAASSLLLPLATSQVAKPQPSAASPAADRAELEQAAALMDQGRFAEAEAQVRRVLQRIPNSSNGHNLLGIIHDQLGRPAEAEADYRTALRLAPGLVSARNNLGNLLARLGRNEEAQ